MEAIADCYSETDMHIIDMQKINRPKFITPFKKPTVETLIDPTAIYCEDDQNNDKRSINETVEISESELDNGLQFRQPMLSIKPGKRKHQESALVEEKENEPMQFIVAGRCHPQKPFSVLKKQSVQSNLPEGGQYTVLWRKRTSRVHKT